MSTYCLPVTMKLARLFGILKLDCCYIDRVPDEILCNIFKFLKSPQYFVNCYNTCKKWRSVIRIPSLQKEVRCKYQNKLIKKCTVFLRICLINSQLMIPFCWWEETFKKLENLNQLHVAKIQRYQNVSICIHL